MERPNQSDGPVRKRSMCPACHAGWPQRPLWAREPWQRTAGAPEKDQFQDGLTRGDASQIPVTGVTVAEGRFKAGLTRDPAIEVPVAGVVVSG